MISDFTDRRPALSAVLIALLYTVVPGAFLLIAEYLPGGGEFSAKIVFVYALVFQVILWLKVERPILVFFPFLMALLGFIISEIIYTVSLSMAPIGAGPSSLAFWVSSALVVLFGTEGTACIGGLLAYGVIVILKRLREFIVYR